MSEKNTGTSQTRLTRRDWLSVSGTAIGAAIVGGTSTGNVAAQTSNEPRINLGDNFHIDDVDGSTLAIRDASTGNSVLTYDSQLGQWSADYIEADKATVGDPGAPLVSNQDTNVSVPGDFATIQEAIDNCPKILRHEYIINVDNGTYNEDLLIGNIHGGAVTTDPVSFGEAGSEALFKIVGDTATPSNVEIDTITSIGCSGGATPQIWGVSVSNADNPHSDEPVSVQFGYNTEAFLGDSTFHDVGGASPTAIQSYGGTSHIRGVDFGADIFTTAIEGKRKSIVQPRDTSGSVTGYAFRSIEGAMIMEDSRGGLVSGASGQYESRYGGFYQRGHDNDMTEWVNTQQMAELGTDITTPTDVTGSRSYSTIYTNDNDYNLMVSVVLTSDGTQGFQSGLLVGGSDGQQRQAAENFRLGSDDISGQTTVTLGPVEVPPGGVYEVQDAANNDATIASWKEWGKTT